MNINNIIKKYTVNEVSDGWTLSVRSSIEKKLEAFTNDVIAKKFNKEISKRFLRYCDDLFNVLALQCGKYSVGQDSSSKYYIKNVKLIDTVKTYDSNPMATVKIQLAQEEILSNQTRESRTNDVDTISRNTIFALPFKAMFRELIPLFTEDSIKVRYAFVDSIEDDGTIWLEYEVRVLNKDD